MISMTLKQIAEAVSGDIYRGDAETLVSGECDTDSRKIERGGVFFAKLGESEDGHKYLVDAALSGAALAIVSTPREDLEIDQIVVNDTVVALSKLAENVLNRVRSRGELKVVGITGSNGKTSTKNMLGAILSPHGKTVVPIASYNNEVGLPLTVLRIEEDTKFLVLELGAAGVGSIAKLASWTKPDIGVQLKVGMAHAGEFGGIEVTEKIKAEMMPFIESAAILNFDDSRVRGFEFSGKKIGFGFSEDAEIRLLSTKLTLRGTTVSLSIGGEAPMDVDLRILGEHHAMNFAAALATARELGISPTDSAAAVAELDAPERWRMQLMTSSEGYSVINDAYNASPESMRSALQSLAVLGRQGNRTVAVLGYMAELGEHSALEHDAVGRLVVRLNIDQLFVIGEEAKLIHMGAMQEGSWDGESQYIEQMSEAFPIIREKLLPGDVVLVKSSNVAGLRFLGDDLAGVE